MGAETHSADGSSCFLAPGQLDHTQLQASSGRPFLPIHRLPQALALVGSGGCFSLPQKCLSGALRLSCATQGFLGGWVSGVSCLFTAALGHSKGDP